MIVRAVLRVKVCFTIVAIIEFLPFRCRGLHANSSLCATVLIYTGQRRARTRALSVNASVRQTDSSAAWGACRRIPLQTLVSQCAVSQVTNALLRPTRLSVPQQCAAQGASIALSSCASCAAATDACTEACQRGVCTNMHQVPAWNDACLKRCTTECTRGRTF